MHLATCDNVHFCFLGDRAIFLDAARDRYSAAPSEVADALRRAIQGTSHLGRDEALLAPLLDQGLIWVTADIARRLAPSEALPAALDWEVKVRANSFRIIAAIAWQLRARSELRARGLGRVLEVRRRTPLPRTPSVSVDAIIAAHRASNLFYAPHARCLIKSLGLFDMLRAAGHRPRLFFGVRDEPFAAHAWVEVDGRIANDACDQVALYRPILVV